MNVTINESTKIPLGIATTILAVVVGGAATSAFWLATFISSVTNATNKNVEQDQTLKAQSELNGAVIQVIHKQQADIEALKRRAGIKN